MWRLVFVLCLLLSSTVFAAENRGQLQVGITITGPGNSSAASSKLAADAIAEPEVLVPRPTERPAAIVPRDNAPLSR
jgi:hypothetical protein